MVGVNMAFRDAVCECFEGTMLEPCSIITYIYIYTHVFLSLLIIILTIIIMIIIIIQVAGFVRAAPSAPAQL